MQSEEDGALDGQAVAVRLPSDPAHPLHERYSEIRDHVFAHDAARGRAPDGNSERLTAGLLAAVARDPLIRRVDEVAFNDAVRDHPAGSIAFAVHRPFGSQGPSFHTNVDVAQALATPPSAHYLETERAVSSLAQMQAHEADRAQERASAVRGALALG